MDFDRYTTSQTFLGLKSFILDNLTQDPSGIRERVAMRFYERMGLTVDVPEHEWVLGDVPCPIVRFRLTWPATGSG